MSQLKLFRQEALKSQFKSAEFSEVIITPPKTMNKAFYLLLFTLVIVFIMAWLIPISSYKWVHVKLQNNNFIPIVFSSPIVLEENFSHSGNLVVKGQPLVEIRRFTDEFPQGKVETAYSPDNGEFFSDIPIGTTISALQPVARILRKSKNNTYYFTSLNQLNSLKLGLLVKIKINGIEYSGKIVSISFGTYSNIGVKFDEPLNRSQLNPEFTFQIYSEKEQRNIFALIGERNAT